MITVKIAPREDDLYDMHVGDEGDQFVNSSQGYERVVDAIKIARRLWPPIVMPPGRWRRNAHRLLQAIQANTESVVMQVTFRDGKTHTERLR